MTCSERSECYHEGLELPKAKWDKHVSLEAAHTSVALLASQRLKMVVQSEESENNVR